MRQAFAPSILRTLFLIISFLIVYGSLFPFQFHTGGLFSALARMRVGHSGLTDSVGNILLFVPFGLVGVALERARESKRGMLPLARDGFLLALFCQLAQIFIPTRIPALIDVAWNMVGIGAGVGLAFLLPLHRIGQTLSIRPASPAQTTRFMATAFGVLAVYMLLGLAPFRFAGDMGQFHWLPFAGLLKGSMIINAVSLAAKVGLLTTAAWLLRRVGWRWGTAGAPVLAATLLEILRLWMPGKGSEITDILLALMAGIMVLQLPVRAGAPAAPDGGHGLGNPPHALGSRAGALAALAVTWAVIAAGIGLIGHVPGVPYNVAELFGPSGGPLDFMEFSAAVLLLGAAPAIAGYLTARSRHPFVLFPIVVGLAGIAVYVPLTIAVTDESMRDIIGTTEILRRLTQDRLLGSFGVRLVNAVGAGALAPGLNVIEPMVRFLALTAPLTVSLSAGYSVVFRRRMSGRSAGRFAMLLGLTALPWLVIAKLIVINLASTDNLTELIAPSVFPGVGGWAYLILLAVLIAAASVMAAWSLSGARSGGRWKAVAGVLVSVPVGWMLLNIGLASSVSKYGINFSATEFLLGADRAAHNSGLALFLRWGLAQLALTSILAFGGLLVIRWLGLAAARQPVASRIDRPANVGVAAGALKPGRPAPNNPGNLMYPFLVNYTASQARFIKKLADHMDRSHSEVAASIVTTAREILDAEDSKVREGFMEDLMEEPRTPGATYCQETLALPEEEYGFIEGLAKEAGASHSCVVRHIVAFFLDNVEEADDKRAREAEAPADDPAGAEDG